MTTTKEGASMPKTDVEDFLNDDPNKITSEDVTATTLPPPPPLPPRREQTKTGRNNWRDRFVSPQGLNISRMMLPPITRRKTATYETIQEAKFDPRIIEGDKAIPPPPLSIPPTYAFFDKGEPDFSIANKMMKNVVRSEVRQIRQNNGELKPQIEEVLDYVDFTNGHKLVNIETEYILYAFLELHPLNESNKHRDRSKKMWFRRTDFDYKSPHVHMLQLDLQDDAVRYVKKMDDKELINLAAAMTNPTIQTINVPTMHIRYDLRLRAMANPEEVLYKSPDKKASKMIDILHALEMQVLEYVPEKHAYFLVGDDQTAFFQCTLDVNPLQDISTYLATADAKEDYDSLMEYVNFWK